MRRFYNTILVFIIVCVASVTKAQETHIHSSQVKSYKEGMELFDKELYSAAQKKFQDAIAEFNDPNTEISVNSNYYAALCAIRLFHRDGDFLMRVFIQDYPESPKVKEAYFQLGIYNHRKRKWKNAIEYFEKVDPLDLDTPEQAEYSFKLGYSYFMEDKFDKASEVLFKIKDADNAYVSPARYYYAHIQYTEGNYQTALTDFEKLSDDPKFQTLVPYYITQIYYNQKKYDKLLGYAPGLLDSAIEKRQPEIAKMIGDAHYHKEQYSEALPYLERHRKGTSKVTDDNKYQLAYANYKSGDYKTAARFFGELSNANDSLSQLSSYQLGDCYLKMNKKNYALNAFQAAYNKDVDAKITEDALFNYAKLSYEVSFDPYNRSISAFQDFLKRYPNSTKRDEVYGYMLEVFMSSKNYDAALEAIEKIEHKNLKLKSAYQLIAYNKGTEEYQNRMYDQAQAYYNKSLNYPVDKKLSALTYYWKGEAYYRTRSYDSSITAYKTFIFEPEAILLPVFNQVNYNLGYAYYKQGEFGEANKWFRKFAYSKKQEDSLKINDAYLRIGDGFFISKKYYDAVDFYSEAEQMQKLDVDYALFQQALCLAILKKPSQQVEKLEKLIGMYPNSSYADASRYQLGRAYTVQDEKGKALVAYANLLTENPNSVFVKKARINTGLLHFNMGDNDKALDVFNKIITDYPNLEDTKEALAAVKAIYLDRGDIEAYTNLVEGLSFLDVSKSELDSTIFEAASLKYFENDCQAAIRDLKTYLEKFPKPLFGLDANYFIADCYNRAGDYANAAPHFKNIAEMPVNTHSLEATHFVANFEFDRDSFANAAVYFHKLERLSPPSDKMYLALQGQMEAYEFLENVPNAALYAEKLLQHPKVDQRDIAPSLMNIAKHQYQSNKLDTAYEAFQLVIDTTTSSLSAQARYSQAEILFKKDSFKLAEQKVFELINQVPSYPYWMANSLLLLSDIYMATDNLFQAKATLNSLIANYQGEYIIDRAKANLKKIEELENPPEETAPEEDEIEIDFGDDFDDEMEALFEEEIIEENEN